MTLPEIPRKTYMMKSTVTSSYEVPQSIYEDPDASMPAVTNRSQSEVKVKPVPRPRIKSLPKIECNTSNNTVDSGDKTSNTTNSENSQRHGYTADYKRPQPVRPAPKPPGNKYVTSSKPTVEVNRGTHHLKSDTETIVMPPAVSTGRIYSPPPPRPERPPLPSTYYDRPRSTIGPKYENYTIENQQSRRSSISSMQLSPVSSVLSDEVLSTCSSNYSTATDFTDRPAVPPRQPLLPHSASERETSPPQTRPPLPPFSPPPPPSIGRSMESLYSEIDCPSYLDILPEDEDIMSQGSTLRLGQHCQSRCGSSHQQTIKDTEDINWMLRWLKRVSKSDVMALSLYGLSIEEEIRTFNHRAMDVRKALRLFNLLMMKRSDSLKNLITEFRSISQTLDKMKKTTKTIGIAGGTTGAVGGVTAVLGIALAPMTMGASLIATAVGAGMVASAGGMGAHAAKSKKKIVNRMAVEKLVCEYKAHVVDLELCLDFILCGMNELRRHDIARLQRAGAQTDALKMAHLSQSVIRDYMNNEMKASVARTAGMSSERLLQAFIKEMDQYFTEKDGQKLRKSSKGKFSGRVRLLAENLQDELDRLNRVWEMFT